MIDNYYLYKNIEELDLHGCNRYEAIVKVDSFINDNKKLNRHLLKIIHGKGNYILKTEVHKYLKNNKKVVAYKLDLYNDGVTIIEI